MNVSMIDNDVIGMKGGGFMIEEESLCHGFYPNYLIHGENGKEDVKACWQCFERKTKRRLAVQSGIKTKIRFNLNDIEGWISKDSIDRLRWWIWKWSEHMNAKWAFILSPRDRKAKIAEIGKTHVLLAALYEMANMSNGRIDVLYTKFKQLENDEEMLAKVRRFDGCVAIDDFRAPENDKKAFIEATLLKRYKHKLPTIIGSKLPMEYLERYYDGVARELRLVEARPWF